MKPNYSRVIGASLLVGLLGLASVAVVHAEPGPMPTDRAGLDAYIRDYILKNPEVLRESLLKLEQDEEVARTKRILSEFKADLYESDSPEIGNPKAKVTIVEFYDYNCPYCRATHLQIKEFLAKNPDTKVVLKDVASLGKESEAIARIVIAATKQGKFEDLHEALMTRKGKTTEAQAIEAAAKLGLDVERLKADARSSETGEKLTRAQDLANRLNVVATPLYIVGHNGIAGAPDDLTAQLTKHVEEIRRSGCDVC